MEQVGIVGAGSGGAALLETFMNTPGVRIIGIADPNPNSPGLMLAKTHGIYSTADYTDLIKKPGKKIIFDATGVEVVAEELQKAADHNTIVVPPEVAELIWKMVDERENINKILLHESSSLLEFIQSGIGQLEYLNNKYGVTLQNTVEEIERLAQITDSSHDLLKETEEIIRIIKNVADKTRILGINAAIESARAGEHGRGFGVVADSIHELAASSVKSTQSVSTTIDDIQKALETITQSVQHVVKDMKNLEQDQMILTQELHSSLEEMGASAQKLQSVAGQKLK